MQAIVKAIASAGCNFIKNAGAESIDGRQRGAAVFLRFSRRTRRPPGCCIYALPQEGRDKSVRYADAPLAGGGFTGSGLIHMALSVAAALRPPGGEAPPAPDSTREGAWRGGGAVLAVLAARPANMDE